METPGFSNPGNTVGLGNPAVPGENGELGSGDTFIPDKPKRKKKMQSLKNYLKRKKENKL